MPVLKSKPIIAVNARFLLPGKLEGIGWYSYETVRRLVADHPEFEFHLLFDRKPDASMIFKGAKAVVLPPQARHPVLWFLWFEWSVKQYLKKIRPLVFLSPDGYACLGSEQPQVLVMHDLAFEHFPDQVPYLVRRYYQYYMPRFAQKATRIATVSEFSKHDIASRYGIQAANISVTYNGSNEIYKPLTAEEKQGAKERWTNGRSYFVYVGSMHPRKNVDGLLRSFEAFKRKGNRPEKLVLIGRMAWQTGSIKAELDSMNFSKDVVFAGHLEPVQLHLVLGSALALTYVSWFEGFGIPILEALNCDIPVICSNTSSMPEVAGEAGILVNPGDYSGIADQMERIADDSDLRAGLIEKGRVQREKFSWDKTANALWKAVESAIG